MKSVTLQIYGKSVVEGSWAINRSQSVNRLYYVNSGTATVLNGNTEYKLTANKIYIIPQCKNFQPISAESFDHTYFDFYSSRILNHRKMIELDGSVLSAKSFFEYINRLIENDTDKKAHSAMENYLCGFLSLIDSCYKPLPYITNAVITRAVNIIHSEFASISTKKLAKELNLNESYFIRLFSSTMGISPMRYIRSVRVAQGKMLIQNGKSISEAADICGYSSPTAFYNATKAEFNVSPSKLKCK